MAQGMGDMHEQIPEARKTHSATAKGEVKMLDTVLAGLPFGGTNNCHCSLGDDQENRTVFS